MRVLTLLFFFVASLGLQAQDCEALKQQIDTQQADIDVLQTRMDEASEYDQKKAVAQEMRAVEGEIRLLKVEYRACMIESGEMGEPRTPEAGNSPTGSGNIGVLCRSCTCRGRRGFKWWNLTLGVCRSRSWFGRDCPKHIGFCTGAQGNEGVLPSDIAQRHSIA